MLNQKGQTLIQLMITASITGIIMIALIAFQLTQTRENKAIAEKLASLDLSRQTSANIMNPAVCNTLFLPANVDPSTPLTFDATAVTPANPYIIKLNSVFGVTNGTSAGEVLAPELMIGLTTASRPGIEVSVTSTMMSNLLINFDQTQLVRAFHDLVIPLPIQTTGPLNATVITGCGVVDSSTSGSVCGVQWAHSGNWLATDHPCNHAPLPNGVQMTCPPGYNYRQTIANGADTQWSCFKQ